MTRLGSPRSFLKSRSIWPGVLGGVAVGAALGVLAAFLGQVRAPEPLLLLLIVAGGLAGAFALSRRILYIGAGILALLLSLCLLTPILRGPLNALVLSQPPQKADAIVVLGGGVQCGTRALEAASLSRLLAGLKLWRAGYAPVVTVSEQSDAFSATCPKMSAIEREIIWGLYPQNGPEVVTLSNVTTTTDEAARVRDLAAARGWKQVLLVTSPSHSRRAAGIFASQGVSVISVPVPETRFDFTLPLPSDRLFGLQVVLYEWLSRLKKEVGGTPER
ncbi:YdcF family protein [Deinococcus arenicola]|uniref:YdcF family protein n=1 Tax=Deinococcus arenicola TaxID=2994950 RepID=A0ABU4DPU0_9DEIO|nr:YdcF family protein [Deinococcus sp. ZS9-10]MDV6374448.1 YdcF family protein [Deinococcus sp. ZS9-10]